MADMICHKVYELLMSILKLFNVLCPKSETNTRGRRLEGTPYCSYCILMIYLIVLRSQPHAYMLTIHIYFHLRKTV